ncbi:MAG: hypothetical protein EA387_14530 [Nitriliruptor sp.]|nr:MAG: hypothetical protein EA387_14530 [Nitriliruptor sp.]
MSTGTLIDHLRELWDLADEATALFAAGGGLGLTALDEARLEAAADTAMDGLRHSALLAGRDRDTALWLPVALGFGDLAVGLILAAAHAGRPPGPVPDRPGLATQLHHLAGLSPRAAAALLACACARGGVATGGDPRFVTTAEELLATARLQSNRAAGPLRSWTAQVEHTTEGLIGGAGRVPRPVAATLAPSGTALAIADPAPRLRHPDIAARIPGLHPRDLIASRTSGRWTIPASLAVRRDRLIASLRPELAGPLRAVTLDRAAAICPPPRTHPR